MRTHIQKACDAIDCDLARVASRVEQLANLSLKDRSMLKDFRSAAGGLREARRWIRAHMHDHDRSATPY